MSGELRIVTHIEEDDWVGERVNQEFYVNDELVGTGWYGGEPEDNTWSRDYAWVDEVITKIAVKLGADVVTEIHEPDEI